MLCMLLDDRISRILHLTYDFAAGQQDWPVLLSSIRDLFDAQMSSILEHRPRENRDLVPASVGLDFAHLRDYERYYWSRNIYLQRGRSLLQEGNVYPHEAYCDDSEILRSEYYNDFQRRLGLFRVLVGVLSTTNGHYRMLTVNRSRSNDAFSQQDVEVLKFLLPHLQRASAIRHRLSVTEMPLRDRYQLTATEARFAQELMSGKSVEEICSELGIQVTTARTHLKHLFQKTNTGRQAELVATLARRA